MEGHEFANLANAQFIESLYNQYLSDKDSVDPSWTYFFAGMEYGQGQGSDQGSSCQAELIEGLINAYRHYGHIESKADPFRPKEEAPELRLSELGFSEGDLDALFPLPEGGSKALREIIGDLKARYCGNIGYELIKLPYIEYVDGQKRALDAETKKRILRNLCKMNELEVFIHKTYVGKKRFSLEGNDSLIPMLNEMMRVAASEGVEEIVLGMAHRGRINVLGNIMDKPLEDVLVEFEPTFCPPYKKVSGDVCYHMGYSKVEKLENGKEIKMVLLDNPSHLESVNPTISGYARRRQEEVGDKKKVIPLVVHGDSAMAGQGVVYETMQMIGVHGYKTGGTIHICINNQLGFTADYHESRSTRYSTDVAKAFDAPTLHVTSLDPESCVYVMQLAVKLRQMFGCDVFIELNGFRKYGHNEGDEPRFTQPLLYEELKKIGSHFEMYSKKLVDEGVVSEDEVKAIYDETQQALREAHERVPKEAGELQDPPEQKSQGIIRTAVDEPILRELAEKATTLPEGFSPHKKVAKLLEDRKEMLNGKIDFGMAETLAYADLLLNHKIPVRISGQDSIRGTFSHRHAGVVDSTSGERYFPLQHLGGDQAPFHVYNSIVSEYGVMGFEYGYNIADLHGLVIWEAQYGDFSNGAQVMIDQYITSCEQKWQRLCSLILMLPHGYEGSGPEHSSARLERILTLCGLGNIQVVVPSTAAQMFHLLRRQALQTVKKPLFIFTPKSLLRYPAALSTLTDFTKGVFQEVICDRNFNAETLILCSGHVYYDLLEKRTDDVAIVRIEQLYPLIGLKELIPQYSHIKRVKWVQEEHENQGAWTYIRPLLKTLLPENIPLEYVGRKESGASAAGTSFLHKAELEEFLREAF